MSWDEALDTIHQQHKRIREAYRPASIFAGSYGWRSNGVLHKASTYYNAIWRWQAVIPGIWGVFDRRGTGIMPYVVGGSEVINSNQLAARAGT
ncbi:molybdopterin-dependent oxidoreductase [Escherichia coli]